MCPIAMIKVLSAIGNVFMEPLEADGHDAAVSVSIRCLDHIEIRIRYLPDRLQRGEYHLDPTLIYAKYAGARKVEIVNFSLFFQVLSGFALWCYSIP
jgi:hypothetical protein